MFEKSTASPAVEAWSLNHWTTMEAPQFSSLLGILIIFFMLEVNIFTIFSALHSFPQIQNSTRNHQVLHLIFFFYCGSACCAKSLQLCPTLCTDNKYFQFLSLFCCHFQRIFLLNIRFYVFSFGTSKMSFHYLLASTGNDEKSILILLVVFLHIRCFLLDCF